VDTYPYGDKEGVAKWTKSITDEYPNFNIVGEVWYHTPAQNAYWQKDSKIGAIESFNSNLPSVMDFTLQELINGGVFHENDNAWDKGMVKIYSDFTSDFMFPNINNVLIFAENHDTDRLNEVYKNDFDAYKMTMTLLATVRGIPQVYYGSEIGMSGSKRVGDGDIRRDFPGGWSGDTNNAFTKAGRTAEQEKYFDLTSKLFNWRKTKSVIHHGKTTHFAPENNVYVYFRYTEQETVMIVINNNSSNQKINLARFNEKLQGYVSGTDVVSGKTIVLDQDLELDAKSALIFELKK
jgi:glycosidase